MKTRYLSGAAITGIIAYMAFQSIPLETHSAEITFNWSEPSPQNPGEIKTYAHTIDANPESSLGRAAANYCKKKKLTA
ncbi:hypothetical protein CS022_23620 [Veronia nyctiphanis]|uniref:Uncharacterized protein n=2 Tax=Veronia nyctiphanis TaxID=1278244 RepID=A0A4Q0YH67_9GAMM|nr:hypothetical protein CS022_23620 [Veronia nyctiphanis]